MKDRSGWRLDEATKRLHLMGIGALKVRVHRPIQGTPKAITVRREGRRFWVSLRCVDVPAQPLAPTGRAVGIDLGVRVLVATSDGHLVTNDRFTQRGAARLARAQQALATKERGSKHRHRAVERVAAAHRHIHSQRANTPHQVSRRLVNDHDLIVHEALPHLQPPASPPGQAPTDPAATPPTAPRPDRASTTPGGDHSWR